MATRRPRPTLEEILNALRAYLLDLGERYGITSLGVFGSYVRGEQRSRSDLDILVEGGRSSVLFDQSPLTLLQFIALENEGARRSAPTRDRLGIRVDLVEKSALKPAIGRRILQEVVML